jgi:hypothetical protein
MDDDITNLLQLEIIDNNKKLIPLKNLKESLSLINDIMIKNNTFLFGIWGKNPFFMSNSFDFRFNFIDGAFFGFICRKMECLNIKHVQFGDDTELACRYFDYDNKILNIKFLCVIHNIANNKGGLRDKFNRVEQQKIDSLKLISIYPNYFIDIKEDLKSKLWLPVKKRNKKPIIEIINNYKYIY